MELKSGARVKVTDKIIPGVGVTPRPGDRGKIDRVLDDGTVIVLLEDGRRALLASWEVELTGEDN